METFRISFESCNFRKIQKFHCWISFSNNLPSLHKPPAMLERTKLVWNLTGQIFYFSSGERQVQGAWVIYRAHLQHNGWTRGTSSSRGAIPMERSSMELGSYLGWIVSIVLTLTLQYSTVQYSTVQYSTVQYSTVQYSTVQYSTVQYSTCSIDIDSSSRNSLQPNSAAHQVGWSRFSKPRF